MLSLIRKRMRGDKGFTLIELLVVIIIIAILAAIAIPTFLGQRNKANDASAKSLVRNAMTAIESNYVDTRTFTGMLKADLEGIEPSITFTEAANAATAPTAQASANEVNYTGDGATYQVGTQSKSEVLFGVSVNKAAGGGNTFYKGTGTAAPVDADKW